MLRHFPAGRSANQSHPVCKFCSFLTFSAERAITPEEIQNVSVAPK